MAAARHPALYEVHTRVWLYELSRKLGRPATLDDLPDEMLDTLARQGFDWFWPLGVWQTGPAGRSVSLHHPQWRQVYQSLLADFTDEDVCGSPFAVQGYTLHADFGNRETLPRLRQRLRERGMRLLLDFVPNHTAIDHPWAHEHPEFYIRGTETGLAREPHNWCRVSTVRGPLILAHGRDPYFPSWPDTLQLNYRHSIFRGTMREELVRVAEMCDGVRCDMAMLILPEVFQRTWGDLSLPGDGMSPVDTPFWPEAIAHVRRRSPQFVFMAEVYWDLEWTLQQQGFDYTYDKRLYERLHIRDAEAVSCHLWADQEFQRRSIRFLENHDEPRAAGAFPPHIHRAAAVVAFLLPGLRYFYEGQLEGRRIFGSLHLRRRPEEPVDAGLQDFYRRLLECIQRPEVRDGRWQLLRCRAAWDENPTWRQFLAFLWESGPDGADRSAPNGSRLLVVVNYRGTRGQCYVGLPLPDLHGKKVRLRDRMSPACYDRDGNDLASRGLYLDLPEWGYHVFEIAVV